MKPDFLSAMLQTIASLVLSSVWGVGSYALCRWLQRRFYATLGLDIFLGLFWFISIPCFIEYVLPVLPFFVLFSIFSGFCLLGGWFHQKSKARTQHWFASATVMAISCIVSVVSGALAIYPLQSSFLWTSFFSTLYCFGLFIYPFLAPLALWIWQSSREARQAVRTDSPVAPESA